MLLLPPQMLMDKPEIAVEPLAEPPALPPERPALVHQSLSIDTTVRQVMPMRLVMVLFTA